MPLQKRKIDIPFVGGIDETTDPKAAEPGKLAKLTNGVMDKRGSLRKVPGWGELGETFVDESADDAAMSISSINSLGGTEAQLFATAKSNYAHRAFRYRGDGEWAAAGIASPYGWDNIPLGYADEDAQGLDCAQTSDYVATLVYNTGGYLSYLPDQRVEIRIASKNTDEVVKVIDLTDAVDAYGYITKGRLLGSVYSEGFGTSNMLYFFFSVGSDNHIYCISINGTTLEAAAAIEYTDDFYGAGLSSWDVGLVSYKTAVWFVLAYSQTTTYDLVIYTRNYDLSVGTKRVFTGFTGGYYTSVNIDNTSYAAYRYWVSYIAYSGGNYLIKAVASNSVSVTTSGNYASGPVTVYTSSVFVKNVFGMIDTKYSEDVVGQDVWRIVFERDSSSDWTESRLATILVYSDGSGYVGDDYRTFAPAPSSSIGGLTAGDGFKIHSRPFRNPSTLDWSIIVAHESEEQPFLALVSFECHNPSGSVSNRMKIDAIITRDSNIWAINYYDHSFVRTSVIPFTAGLSRPKAIFYFPFINIFSDDGRYDSGGAPINPQMSVYYSKVYYDFKQRWVGNRSNMAIGSGGRLQLWDGKLNAFPFLYGCTDIAKGATTGAASGVYSTYVSMFEAYDGNGNVYRSTPSPALTVERGATGVDLTVMFYQGDTSYYSNGILIVIYRLESDGVYHRLGAIVNNPNSSTYGDTFSDTSAASIEANESLYTTGGILPNDAPPPPAVVAAGMNRIWLVPHDNKRSLWYSKEQDTGVGVEFVSQFKLYMPDDGDITAAIEMDAKMIVFKRTAIYIVSGDGPNSAGYGSQFAVQKVSSEIGCVDIGSVLLTRLGVFFRSSDGIKLLDRSLSVVDIGEQVVDYDDTIVQSISDPTRGLAMFATEGGEWLVFDMVRAIWSVITAYGTADNLAMYGDASWLVWSGDSTSVSIRRLSWVSGIAMFSANSSPYAMTVETQWIALDGIAGLKRVYWLELTGEYKSAHSLVVKLYYDYNSTVAQTLTWTATTDYRLRIHPAQQKCSAIKVEIYDSAQAGTYESMALTSLSMVVGAKGGISRLPAANSL